MTEPRPPVSALERLRQGERPAAAAAGSRRRGVVGGLVAAGALVLGKLKLALLLVLKLGKFLTASWTMLLSVWLYAAYFGHVRFAVGVVLLVFIHECGHALAARALGLPVRAPVFIPFFGAFTMTGRARSSWEDFVVAAGGPLVGGLAAIACALTGLALAGESGGLLVALGYYALVLNLLNLTPFWVLDGVSMLRVVGWRAGLGGAALALLVLVAAGHSVGHFELVPLVVIGFAVWQLGRRGLRERGAERRAASALEQLQQQDAVPDLASEPQRLLAAVVYFGAIAVLTVGLHLVHPYLPSLR